MRLPLIIRKHFFTVRMAEHWHRKPREVVESSSFKIFKSYLDMDHGHWLSVTILQQEGEPDLRRSLATSGILWFCNFGMMCVQVYTCADINIHVECAVITSPWGYVNIQSCIYTTGIRRNTDVFFYY